MLVSIVDVQKKKRGRGLSVSQLRGQESACCRIPATAPEEACLGMRDPARRRHDTPTVSQVPCAETDRPLTSLIIVMSRDSFVTDQKSW